MFWFKVPFKVGKHEHPCTSSTLVFKKLLMQAASKQTPTVTSCSLLKGFSSNRRSALSGWFWKNCSNFLLGKITIHLKIPPGFRIYEFLRFWGSNRKLHEICPGTSQNCVTDRAWFMNNYSLLDTLSALVKPPKTCSTNETTKIRQRKQKKRITARVIQLWLFNEFWVKNKSITHLAKGHANESLNFIISYYQHMLSPKIHVKVVHWLR